MCIRDSPEVADELRDVLVRVASVEDVSARDRRILDVTVVEVARDGEVLRLSLDRVQTRERVVGAAVFARDVHVPHAVELLGAELRQAAVRPVADLRRDVERLVVSGQRVRGEETGEDLMKRVIRRPDALVAAVGGEFLEAHELRLGTVSYTHL